jgi:hypothetical protein
MASKAKAKANGKASAGPGRIDIPAKAPGVKSSAKPSPGISLTQGEDDNESFYSSNPLKASTATSTHRPKMHKRSGGLFEYPLYPVPG